MVSPIVLYLSLSRHGRIIMAGCVSAVLLFVLVISVSGFRSLPPTEPELPPPPEPELPRPPALAPLNAPVRPVPKSFARNTHRPTTGEGATSGSIVAGSFSAGRDLIYFEDKRIWWESDHDTGDDECDHSMHKAAERPLRRLVELVTAEKGVLEVHDAYRGDGIHNTRSLHREGRALDLTCDQLGLERLAELCWAAGFDWVYYEAGAAGGPHVHASVKRDHKDTLEAYGLHRD